MFRGTDSILKNIPHIKTNLKFILQTIARPTQHCYGSEYCNGRQGRFFPPFHKSSINIFQVKWFGSCALQQTSAELTRAGEKRAGSLWGRSPKKARGTEAWDPQARVNNNLQESQPARIMVSR
jgi:hypothetical protein